MMIKIFDKELEDEIYLNSEKIVCIFPNFDGSELYLSDGTTILSTFTPNEIYDEIYKEECKKRNCKCKGVQNGQTNNAQTER